MPSSVQKARLVDQCLVFQHLSCEYRGVYIDDGSADLNANATYSSKLVYEWQVRAGGAHEKALVPVLCSNAAKQGVPFPSGWQTALKCQQLTSVAQSAAEEARGEIGRDVDCTALGVIRTQGAPSASSGDVLPGTVLSLETGDVRIPYILCALVSGNKWLCHRGSFEDENLDASNPFSEKDLVH